MDIILDIKEKFHLFIIILIAVMLINTGCSLNTNYTFDEENMRITYKNVKVGYFCETDDSDYSSSLELFMKACFGSDVTITNSEYKFTTNSYDVYVVDFIIEPSAAMNEIGETEEKLKIYVAIDENNRASAYILDNYSYTDEFENDLRKQLSNK